jgi:chorismate mutase
MGGARTTVNPFAMQELADALQGTKNCIGKNPVNQIYLYG